MIAVQRELERRSQEQRNKINERTRIAQTYCKGFERAVLMTVTDENTAIWIEQCGVTYDQMDRVIDEARKISEGFAQIADFIEHTIKPNHWRNITDKITDEAANG